MYDVETTGLPWDNIVVIVKTFVNLSPIYIIYNDILGRVGNTEFIQVNLMI